jgi:hypothetical protein
MLNLLIPVIGTLLDKVLPDPKMAAEAKFKIIELAQKGELANLEADVKLAIAQTEINKVEASTDMFRGGWRPFVGLDMRIRIGYPIYNSTTVYLGIFIVRLQCNIPYIRF